MRYVRESHRKERTNCLEGHNFTLLTGMIADQVPIGSSKPVAALVKIKSEKTNLQRLSKN